jgi:outer membrane protein OmpA-like peptidoglycan-associated protein
MSFKKKMILVLLVFSILGACTTTIIQAPVLLELTRPVSLQQASVRGAKHLFNLVQQERGWRSEVLATRILIVPTVQENTTKVLEPSKQIEPYLQQEASSFKGFQLVTPETRGTSPINYELHSSMLMTEDKGKEKIVLTMWMTEPISKRKLSTVSSAIRVDNKVNKPNITRNANPQTWNLALQEASQNVLQTASQDRAWRTQLAATQILLVPMFDANSKENLNLTSHLQSQLQKQTRAVNLAIISQKLLPQAHYIIHSALGVTKGSEGQIYDLNVWMRDAKTGRLLAASQSKVLSTGLPYALTAESKDSPVYTAPLNANSQGFDLKAEMQRTNYPARLQVDAILSDAAQAYGSAQYARALKLYETAATMKEGLNLRSLAGRYLSLLRMNRPAEARVVFSQLLKYGFSTSNTLTFKILFAVDSTQFAGGKFLSDQYTVWAEEIATYVQNNQRCILVAGHSSHSGSEAYNLKLSTERASLIRQTMASKRPAAGPRTSAEGKGFHENIVGSGTDDARDAVDRRVEFRQQACQ